MNQKYILKKVGLVFIFNILGELNPYMFFFPSFNLLSSFGLSVPIWLAFGHWYTFFVGDYSRIADFKKAVFSLM